MYQDDHTVVNAEVAAAGPGVWREIERLALAGAVADLGMAPVAAEAFFFRRLHVARRADPAECVTVDLEARTTTGSTSTLHVGAPELRKQPAHAYDPGASSQVCIPIAWGGLVLEVHFSRHAQVRNGLRLAGVRTGRATGLLVRNYRPNLFRVPTLADTRPVSLPSGCLRVLTKRGIAGHREVSAIVYPTAVAA